MSKASISSSTPPSPGNSAPEMASVNAPSTVPGTPTGPTTTSAKSYSTSSGQPPPSPRMAFDPGIEVRYERSFLLDLLTLSPKVQRDIQKFVFTDFYQLHNIYDLPNCHRLIGSEIYYRFTLVDHLLIVEVAGRIIKFIRILPKPNL